MVIRGGNKMKIRLIGETQSIVEGINLLLKDLDIQVSEDGYPIEVTQRPGPLQVENKNGQGQIYFEKKIHFFRAIGLWLQHYKKESEFELTEEPQFEMHGAMLDASRNAVLTVDGVKNLLRKMSIMGLNVLMVYTEDTYEVKEYPYFGYMRGRYTEKELKICDDYAAELGIEMIPCIQTLAHLTEALKWNYATEIKDTSDILLVGKPETYTFLENIIKAASAPFRSNRIHIGMDEAHQLGLGKYLDINGFSNRFDLMNQHLKQVLSITEELGLNSMIWSDMYFRLGSKTGGYYDLEADIPQEVIDSIPNAQLVYWDYYHADESFYQTFIQKHKELGSEPIFAGGVWTWNGIAPNYGKTMVTTDAALSACKKEGIKEIFATMWGDNGSETPFITCLPGLQLFAEHSYHRDVDKEYLEERFAFCTGGNFSDFLTLNDFDETPGVSKDNLQTTNPSKLLLWQDVLIGLYDENIRGLSMNEHYEALIPKLKTAKERNSEMELLFAFYEQLARVLSVKAELGLSLKSAYDNKDKDEMKSLSHKIEGLKLSVDELRQKHRSLWFSTNKPFGFEIIDIRYGGLIARIDTATHRIEQWLEGEIESIEELDAERLYYEGPWKTPDGSLGSNYYHRIVTAGTFSG